jgi:hypothetical protein
MTQLREEREIRHAVPRSGSLAQRLLCVHKRSQTLL